jgi:hypothetical protein
VDAECFADRKLVWGLVARNSSGLVMFAATKADWDIYVPANGRVYGSLAVPCFDRGTTFR